MAEKASDGASLIVVVVPPAARSLAPLPKAGSSCRDCASSPLLLPRAGRADPGASSRKAGDYGDRPPGCQLTLARFYRHALTDPVTADFRAVGGIEAQKAEGGEQRD